MRKLLQIHHYPHTQTTSTTSRTRTTSPARCLHGMRDPYPTPKNFTNGLRGRDSKSGCGVGGSANRTPSGVRQSSVIRGALSMRILVQSVTLQRAPEVHHPKVHLGTPSPSALRDTIPRCTSGHHPKVHRGTPSKRHTYQNRVLGSLPISPTSTN